MAKYSKNDIIRIVDEEDIEFIRLQFTDIFGTLKNVAITASQLEKALDNKCMFDGSSIEGFVRIEESDMYLHPDLDTFMIFPWRPQQGKVARIICDVYMADGTPFEGDPRYILKKQIEKAKQMGYIFNVGPECEFFLFHLDENGQPTTISHERAVYLAFFFIFFSLIVVVSPHSFRSVVTFGLFALCVLFTVKVPSIQIGSFLIAAVVIYRHFIKYLGEPLHIQLFKHTA